MKKRYIVKISAGCADFVGMRKTKKAAKELLAEYNVSDGNGGSITTVEPGDPWYNGIC